MGYRAHFLQNLNNGSCINLFLTNKCRRYQHFCNIKVRFWDFHKMTVTPLKIQDPKLASMNQSG